MLRKDFSRFSFSNFLLIFEDMIESIIKINDNFFFFLIFFSHKSWLGSNVFPRVKANVAF